MPFFATTDILGQDFDAVDEAKNFLISSGVAQLFFKNQQRKSVRDNRRARTRIVLGGCWGGAQVRCDEIDVVGGAVDGHGARTSLGLDRFDRRKGCWRIFVGDGQSSVAARRKR